MANKNLILLSGKSTTGKSASLMGIDNPEGVLYLNCENGKDLPFKAKFKQITISDPYQVFDAFDWVEKPENKDKYHTVVIDSLTYLMDMFETIYIYKSTNGQQAWADFQQYFKQLMQQYVTNSTKSVIFTAHTTDSTNETEMVRETAVPIKGALKNNGIESYFTVVMSSKKMPLKKLKDYGSPLLTITPEEEALGFKYVFQTKITSDTVHERIRGPLGMWDTKESFIDNNMQFAINRLQEYYA